MTALSKSEWRQAARIHARMLAGERAIEVAIEDPAERIRDQAEELVAVSRHAKKCAERGWHAASAGVRDRLLTKLDDLLLQISQFRGRFRESRGWGHDLRGLLIRDVLGELGQVRDEFGEFRYDHGESLLTVTTEPITLQGIELGRFEIRLRVDRLKNTQSGPPYEIVALDPNRPESNDSITHPHVSDDRLCEGDASAAIRAALDQGRLCDFFLLVRSVLTTYNEDSPYVRLDEWDGIACYDCGDVTSQSYWCECCHRDFCDDCFSHCEVCERSVCAGCAESCPSCEDRACPSCRRPCEVCGKTHCTSCLEENTCPDCRATTTENEDDDPDSQQVPVADEPGAPDPAPA